MTNSQSHKGLISQQHMPQTSSPNALRWRVGLTPATERNVRHLSFSDWKCVTKSSSLELMGVQAQSVGSLCPSRRENTENGRIRRGTQEAPCGCHSRPPTAVQGELARGPPLTTQSSLHNTEVPTRGRVPAWVCDKPALSRAWMVTLFDMRSEVTGS